MEQQVAYITDMVSTFFFLCGCCLVIRGGGDEVVSGKKAWKWARVQAKGVEVLYGKRAEGGGLKSRHKDVEADECSPE